ncbi:unnamed protein product [Parnassius apollo]|uniref:(apollo) hypothetical protein n=1 Tax=Parnassius apollo TaxID=110799 RepID=A0A8S3WXK9_PARAO|nr:unnamed protein product [Parnassius apollo]
MEPTTLPLKKVKSPSIDDINTKSSVTCSNVPDGLFDETTAKKHFSKFGRPQKIRLFPKSQKCIVEYDEPTSAERAVLNAGAFDGFMFDVTRTKTRIRRKSKKDDDPDWVPDSDVEEELSAMRGAPTYRISRQKAMDIDPVVVRPKVAARSTKLSPLRKSLAQTTRAKQTVSQPLPAEPPALVTMSTTSLSTSEAAAELHQLRSRISLTPDEQWRTLDARDRILRAWGGAGSRVKEGGATIGTCPDMCPEKELLHRQAEHQVMTLETVPDSDGLMEPWRAVKQYSRSSADQEMPMCYELRPAHVLMRTCAYLLNEIADTSRQVSLADWFHFMWDRFRSIRKDITQQALCCADSIWLVETCARFHAHCAARLADLEHTQFDQKLNTDNLTKCLQTLKHMYADVEPALKPNEAEFRGYIALLNLGDANFWWEIKQLPQDIQKSESIMFAIKVFTALDNNNYVRFFRLVQEKATYLQACILLRYFNDVRARALARFVKAYAPRGGSKFPAQDMINALAFESTERMKSFINHYGLRFAKTDSELSVILDRNQFIEDSDPYPLARAINLIESKRQTTVGEVIAGGPIPKHDYSGHMLYSSFNKDGKLKETALIAEDLGYNTKNDSNKDIEALKTEIQRLSSGGRFAENISNVKDVKKNVFSEFVPKSLSRSIVTPSSGEIENKSFLFQPAIPVAPSEIIKTSPVNETKNIFRFSKPQQDTTDNSLVKKSHEHNPFLSSIKSVEAVSIVKEAKNSLFKQPATNSLFMSSENKNGDIFKSRGSTTNLFTSNKASIFNEKDNKKTEDHNTALSGANNYSKIFGSAAQPDRTTNSGSGNLFTQVPISQQNVFQKATNIFKEFTKSNISNSSIFAKSDTQNAQNANEDLKVSPGTLFKSACQPEKVFSFFPSKNKPSTIADNIFNSVKASKDVYEFQDEDNSVKLLREEKAKEIERKMEEEKKSEEAKRLQQLEEAKRKEEERKKLEKQKQEEIRKKEEERKREELRKQKLEEERKAELKRKAEEDERMFKEKVEKDSNELLTDLIEEINTQTVQNFINDELESLKKLVLYSQDVTEELLNEICKEISMSEVKAELFWTQKLMKKWFSIWRKQYLRNRKRRNLLEDTPVWLTDYTPVEEANSLRRVVEVAALRNMNAIHRGYKFTGELNHMPPPEPINIMEIIRSPLLKRMKQIQYPYDKCFFWKVAMVSPGSSRWLYKRINIKNWLLETFSDKNKSDKKDGLIYVGKQSWNHLMDFAISVSLIDKESMLSYNEAVEGAHGFLFYQDENYLSILETIEEIMKCKYPYQIVPVAFIIPKLEDISIQRLEQNLQKLINDNVILCYKIFVVEKHKLNQSLHSNMKSALKWLAKKCPKNPPIEIDYLKSICQRYLANEIWYKLKSETDSRIVTLRTDLKKLITCYNAAVDKLTDVITNEDLFNYPSFPLEFDQYLSHDSPYPKPFEFIPSSTKHSENVLAIKSFMKRLKLINSPSEFHPSNSITMQQQIRSYCKQIGWFDNPEKVACKVLALLPSDFSNLEMPCEDFSKIFEQYNLIDFLNIVVYEKINSLHNFDNRFAIYDKASMEEYRNVNWLYEIEVVSGMKHKAIEYEDELDLFISAKRRKLDNNEMEYLMLEDKDCTLVEESIKSVEKNISSYNDCSDTMRGLEKQLEEERRKSYEFENLLRAALSDV